MQQSKPTRSSRHAIVALLLISSTWFIGEFIVVGSRNRDRQILGETVSAIGFAIGIAVFVIGHLRARKTR